KSLRRCPALGSFGKSPTPFLPEGYRRAERDDIGDEAEKSAERNASDGHRLQQRLPKLDEFQVRQRLAELQFDRLQRHVAVKQEPSSFKRDGPDERICQRIADEGCQSGSNDVAGEQPGQGNGDEEVKPEKRREGSEHTRSHAGGNRMRRCRQAQDALGVILNRTADRSARPDERPGSLPNISWLSTSKQHLMHHGQAHWPDIATLVDIATESGKTISH